MTTIYDDLITIPQPAVRLRCRPLVKSVASPVAGTVIRRRVLANVDPDGRCGVRAVDAAGYLAFVTRDNCGYFIVDGAVNRATFKAIVAEATAAGLNQREWNVFGKICTYSGPNLNFYNLPD